MREHLKRKYSLYRRSIITQMGEEGEGRLRRRVHGSAGLCGNPKPSYETVKRECAPLYISSIKAINTDDNSDERTSGVEIVIANKNALPCYEAKGYHLAGFDGAGCLISYTTLEPLKPGETQKIFPCRCALTIGTHRNSKTKWN